ESEQSHPNSGRLRRSRLPSPPSAVMRPLRPGAEPHSARHDFTAHRGYRVPIGRRFKKSRAGTGPAIITASILVLVSGAHEFRFVAVYTSVVADCLDQTAVVI